MTSAPIASPERSGNHVFQKAYVYVIRFSDQAIKIGVAKDVERHLRTLQAGSPSKLTLVGAVECTAWDSALIEAKAHSILKSRRLIGEWFSVTAEDGLSAVSEAARLLEREKLQRAKGIFPVNRR